MGVAVGVMRPARASGVALGADGGCVGTGIAVGAGGGGCGGAGVGGIAVGAGGGGCGGAGVGGTGVGGSGAVGAVGAGAGSCRAWAVGVESSCEASWPQPRTSATTIAMKLRNLISVCPVSYVSRSFILSRGYPGLRVIRVRCGAAPGLRHFFRRRWNRGHAQGKVYRDRIGMYMTLGDTIGRAEAPESADCSELLVKDPDPVQPVEGSADVAPVTAASG